jgi:NADH-quinone oxidoreductase subunit J
MLQKIANIFLDNCGLLFVSGLTWYILFLFMLFFLLLSLSICYKPIYILLNFIVLITLISVCLRLYGAEFISIVVIIIYVGVFAVLFLFTLIIYEDNQNDAVRTQKRSFNYKVWLILSFLAVLPVFGLLFNIVFFISSFTSSVSLSFVNEELQHLETLYVDYWLIVICSGWLIFFVIVGVLAMTRYRTYLNKCY